MTVTEEAGHGAEAEEAGDTARTVQSTERARAPERWSVQSKSELVLPCCGAKRSTRSRARARCRPMS